MADIPVESGHELVLATLLVHFDVDELEQLPLPLRRAVQDVYEIASDLAANKLRFQQEAAQLRGELSRFRGDALPACAASAKSASQTAPGTPRESTRISCKGHLRVADGPRPPRSVPIKSEKLRSSKPTRDAIPAISTTLPRSEGPACFKPEARDCDRCAVRPRVARVAPIPDDLKRQSPGDHDQQCLEKLVKCELQVYTMQRKLSQVALWKPTYRGGRPTVLIPHLDGLMRYARAHSVDDVQVAIEKLRDQVECVRNDSLLPVQTAVNSEKCESQLEARRAKLEGMLEAITRWIDGIGAMLDKFTGRYDSSGVTDNQHRVAVISVWNDVRDRGASHPSGTSGSCGLEQPIPALWRPSAVLFIEYAVSSFLMQTLEVYVKHAIRGLSSDTLYQVGEAARTLEDLLKKFEQVTLPYSEEQTRVREFSHVLSRRHTRSLASIHKRAAACSKAICAVKTDTAKEPSSRVSGSTEVDEFPADPSLQKPYDDIAIAILSCHVALTRIREVPERCHTEAKEGIVARLRVLEEDSHSSAAIAAHNVDRNKYVKLVEWCSALRGIAMSHGQASA